MVAQPGSCIIDALISGDSEGSQEVVEGVSHISGLSLSYHEQCFDRSMCRLLGLRAGIREEVGRLGRVQCCGLEFFAVRPRVRVSCVVCVSSNTMR